MLIAQRGQALLSAAVLLGGSRAAGEDLLQSALERVVRSWRRIDGNLEAYLRRTLYNLAVDGWRHRGRNPEVLAAAEPPAVPDGTHIIDLRGALVDALGLLAPRQRAVLVLRYWEERSEAETAALLECSVGTVKSTASRALQKLRDITAAWELDDLPVAP